MSPNTDEPQPEKQSTVEPEAAVGASMDAEELDDAFVIRGFRGFAILAVLVLVLALLLTFYRADMSPEVVRTGASLEQSEDSISVQVQRAKKFPRVGESAAMAVSPLEAATSPTPLTGNAETLRFSGSLSLTTGLGSKLEVLSVSPWPEGILRRWGLEPQGLVETSISETSGGVSRGWISLASLDVNGDGLEDIVTGGLGVLGCWLRDPAKGHFLWQSDACGLIVDGDTWVSSIEAVDVNGDGASDLWLNLMTKRADTWLGKPNALWLSSDGKFQRGETFLKSSPPSRASFASNLYDLDRDGVSEILVSNLDGPMEIWRQISGHPFVESRQFFGVGALPQVDNGLLVGELEGEPILAYSHRGKSIAYTFPKRAIGTSIDDTFHGLGSIAPRAERLSWWDYDLDGKKDLLIGTHGCLQAQVQGSCSTRALMRNEQSPRGLLNPQVTAKFEKTRGFGLYLKWDLDGDGDEDFIVMRSDGNLDLQMNQTDLGHHWLGLSFAARWAGADLTVYSSEGSIHREVIQTSNGTRVNQGLWRLYGLKDAFYVTRISLSHPIAGSHEFNKPQPVDTWLHFD